MSSNPESIPVYKSLETMERSSIIKHFSSDNLFLKAALDLSFEPSDFIPGLIPIPEWMIVSPVFTADIPAGPSERFFRVFATTKQCFFAWHHILLSLNGIYLCLNCLKKMCRFVLHYVHYT